MKENKKRLGEKRKRGKGRKWEVNLLHSEKQKCNPNHRRKKTINTRIIMALNIIIDSRLSSMTRESHSMVYVTVVIYTLIL